MIYLGLDVKEKIEKINNYVKNHNIKKIFILSPEKFYFEIDEEFIEWNQIIMYKTFYRLLQEIDNNSLIVINECLRKQNRYDLTYNCIRHFLNQTKHQLIFQYLPIIDNMEDFFILFDFDTKTKWKGKTDYELLKNSYIIKKEIKIDFQSIEIPVDKKLKERYSKKKNDLINNIGLKDPDTIPRNLYLISGNHKLNYLNENRIITNIEDNWYIGINNRFKLGNFQTFKNFKINNKKHIVFELCFNFIDFIDFLTLSKQTSIEILTTDLKIDKWFFERYQQWMNRINDVYSKI